MIFKLVGTLKTGRDQIISLHPKSATMGPSTTDTDNYLKKKVNILNIPPSLQHQAGWYMLVSFK